MIFFEYFKEKTMKKFWCLHTSKGKNGTTDRSEKILISSKIYNKEKSQRIRFPIERNILKNSKSQRKKKKNSNNFNVYFYYHSLDYELDDKWPL